MRKLKLFLCLWMLLEFAGFLLMPGANAQSPPSTVPPGITYVRAGYNWVQTPSGTLTMGVSANVTLSPCPDGIDTTSGASGGYQVALYTSSNPPPNPPQETVNVVANSAACSGGSQVITFTPFYSYTAGYTIGSASAGIQETINLACGTSSTPTMNSQCNVTIPANNYGGTPSNTYNVYGTIFFHSNQSILDGPGVSLLCTGRGPCLQVGDLVDSNDYVNDTVRGISFRSPNALTSNPSYVGVPITQTCVGSVTGSACSLSSNVAQITTSSAHGFRVGDMVTIQFTDNPAYWGDAIVTAVPTSTTFQYTHPKNVGTDTYITSQSTPGIVALAYVAVLDNAENSHFIDLAADKFDENGAFNNWFDMWDDENATIDHFNNNASSLNANANWTGAFVFSGGAANTAAGSQQFAPVITLRDSTITANYSNCVTDYNSNGLYIENTVCQASGLWEVYSSNITGNYQGAYLKNIYSESSLSLNPYWSVSGSVTSGTFSTYEEVKQSSTLAVAYLENAVVGSNTTMLLGALTGTPDSSHTWVGQTSGAQYTPTSLPTAKTPFPGLGIGGLIAGSSSGAANFQIRGSGGTAGAAPSGGSGSTTYAYYIVAHDGSIVTSPMLALVWSFTGSSSPVISWPRVANGGDSISYDVIRMAYTNGWSATYPAAGNCGGGTGGACGSIVTYLTLTQSVACGNTLVCSYTDSGPAASTSSYPILQAGYNGPMNFWPGAIVSVNKTVNTDIDEYGVTGVGLNGNPIEIADACPNYGGTSAGGYIVCLNGPVAFNNSVPNQTATLLPDGPETGHTTTLAKGRLNFSSTAYSSLAPHHIITLIDSQPALTQATWGYRPQASPNDVWIGTDAPVNSQLYQGQLAMGAPVYITNYIGDPGNGSILPWRERLTSTVKMFAVPIQTPAATLTLNTTSIGANTCAAQTATITGLATSSVVKWSFASTPIGVTGYGTGGLQISTFATANTANIVVCNITGASITPGAMTLNLRAEL